MALGYGRFCWRFRLAAQALAQGGSFVIGFAAGAIGSAAGGLAQSAGITNAFSRVAIAAAVGGTSSVLAGGKFANGAITAAFATMYNECAHGGCAGVPSADGMWQDVQEGVVNFGNSAMSSISHFYMSLVPGYSLAECGVVGGCGTAEWGLAAAGVAPGLKYTTSAGTMIVREVMTASGAMTVAGRMSVNGTVLLVDDLLVIASDGKWLARGSLGTRGVLDASKPLLNEAKAAGFTEVQVNAVRISGANPGRPVSFKFDLTK